MCLGVAGRIVRFTDAAHHRAIVDVDGVHSHVNTAMVAADDDPPSPGDWVMVHLGIAVERVEPEVARSGKSEYDELMAEFEALAAERGDES